MAPLINLLWLLSVAGAAPFRKDLDGHWELFKKAHQKTYSSFLEEATRRQIWEWNLQKVVNHNIEADLKKLDYKLGLNSFSDLTLKEYASFNGYKLSNRSSKSSLFLPALNADYPVEVDWRKQGFVTEVKNQGNCGSCWAFSTTGSLEGQTKRKTGVLPSLSEQNLVDCSRGEGNEGCNGGQIDAAFEYVKQNGGLDTEESYPYTATEGTCHFRKRDIGATVTGYIDIPQGDEKALMKAVATVGPVSVAIDASHDTFQLYSHGIYEDLRCSPTDLDHGVLVVGYGTENGKDFWIVKNSWGPKWGENGYVRMVRNKNNHCGIATMASYPLV